MKLPLRILHLEDDPNDVEITRATLSRQGIACELVRVGTRADFLAAIEDSGCDLIFAGYALSSFDAISALAAGGYYIEAACPGW